MERAQTRRLTVEQAKHAVLAAARPSVHDAANGDAAGVGRDVQLFRLALTAFALGCQIGIASRRGGLSWDTWIQRAAQVTLNTLALNGHDA